MLLISRHPQGTEDLPPDCLHVACDVANGTALREAVGKAESLYSSVECLINNAGFLRIGPLADRPKADIS